jgi:hypothetical protein
VLRLLADENFNGRILRALRRQLPELDVLRLQDTPLSGTVDPAVLEWAANEKRVALTHDVSTMVGHAYHRVRSLQPMSGVIAVRTDRRIGQILEDLEILVVASRPEELDARVIFVPL